MHETAGRTHRPQGISIHVPSTVPQHPSTNLHCSHEAFNKHALSRAFNSIRADFADENIIKFALVGLVGRSSKRLPSNALDSGPCESITHTGQVGTISVGT